MKIIQANNVIVLFSKGFRRKKIRALDGFSISIDQGDIFGLLGPNGAGKSTAMYCFLGLIKPDHGEVKIFDTVPVPGSAIFKKMTYLPEEPHYHLYLTVKEAVTYYGSLYGKSVSSSEIEQAIEKVGLQDFQDLRLSQCSKGMKQKTGIAVCLLGNPELVFLDEPTRGLDPLIVKQFRDILLEMNSKGVTIVINSHILSEVEMVCNKVAIMNEGKVITQDDLKNLMQFDLEHYEVEFDFVNDVPDFVSVQGKNANTIMAIIPRLSLEDFFRFAHENNLKVHSCSLKRLSLEDAFFRILKGDTR